jgi:hypothetical protein
VSTVVASVTRHQTPDGTQIDRDCGCICEVHPADPAHVTARGWHACASTLGERTTTARADVTVESDAEAFEVAIDLEVRVNGAAHATRAWRESIPRRLL